MAISPERHLTPPMDEMVDDERAQQDLVDPESDEPVEVDGAIVYKDAQGNTVVDFGGDTAGPANRPRPIIDDPFYENLAEREELFSDSELRTIGNELVDLIEEDEKTRAPWRKRLVRGIRLMGVTDDRDTGGPFKGASRVVHPVLIEAGVQSQARAFAELCPAAGPVKPKVFGDADQDIRDRSDRGAAYMNYQYTEEMPEAFDEMDSLLFRLPFEGSCFKKVYFDLTLGRQTQVMIPGTKLIVPYNATSLETAPRYTEELRKYPNDVKRAMLSGEYRQIDLSPPRQEEQDEVDQIVENIEGKEKSSRDEDERYKIYECHVEYDFKIDALAKENEHLDEDKQPIDLALPYIITIEAESGDILAIRRNWKKDDLRKKKRVWYIHYKYLPGFGFYGFGLFHCIGGLAQGATGALRNLLDSAAFASLQGGFKSRDAKFAENDMVLRPGEWRETDMTSDELSKSFFRIPYTEPSVTLFQLLGFLVEAGQRFASTTEAMVGDADNKGPVGTTVALIEQGSKVYSTIHRRLHRAQGREFKLVAAINYETLPLDEPYPYRVRNGERLAIRDDFDGRVDFAPVSDPNIFSATQRISLSQAVYQIAIAPGSTLDRRESERRMLQALQIPDYDQLQPDPSIIPRMTAVEENMALLYGKPIRAYPDQDHGAHIAVLDSWFQGLPPEGQKMLMGHYTSHRAEHMAYQYRLEMEKIIGKTLPPPPDFSKPADKMVQPGTETPPDVEHAIDAAAAQAAQVYAKAHPPQKSPEQIAAESKSQLDQMHAQTESTKAETDKQYKAGQLEVERQRLANENTKLGIDGQVAQVEAGIKLKAQAEAIALEAQANARAIEMQAQADAVALRNKTDAEILVMREKSAIENDPKRRQEELDRKDRIDRYKIDEDNKTKIKVAEINAAATEKAAKAKGANSGKRPAA